MGTAFTINSKEIRVRGTLWSAHNWIAYESSISYISTGSYSRLQKKQVIVKSAMNVVWKKKSNHFQALNGVYFL